MGYHPRIEGKNLMSFQTTRTMRSELWFIKNQELENAILGYLAKYKLRYGAHIYAFAIEGNHLQFPALFPNANRAHFMRDLNSSIARAVPRHQKKFKGGKVFGRRYSGDYIPWEDDALETFIYTVLQPVQDGLVDHIRDYKGYNCFEDAINERERVFEVVDWKRYHAALDRNKFKVPRIEDYTEKISFKYERLPQFRDMPKEEYIKMMREIIEARIKEILENRKMNDFLNMLAATEANNLRRKEWERVMTSNYVYRGAQNGEPTPTSPQRPCTPFDKVPQDQPNASDDGVAAKSYAEQTQVLFKADDIVKDFRKTWKEQEPGDEPFFTKTSTIDSHRPRILSKDKERLQKGLKWYFAILSRYMEASKAYREGNLLVEFPQGTYRPPMFTVAIERVEIMLG